MTDLLLSEADLDTSSMTVYDMAMGTSQMLSCMEERIHELNSDIEVTCFGQEFNPSTFAIAKADIIIVLREFCQYIHIVRQCAVGFFGSSRIILVELSHQHTISSLGILVGTVSLEVFLHLASAIEFVSSSKVAALHLAEDRHGIDKATFVEVEVDARTQKFLSKHRNIEAVGIVASEVASLESSLKVGSHLLESLGFSNICIRDTCELCNESRDRFFGIEEHVYPFLFAVGINFDV